MRTDLGLANEMDPLLDQRLSRRVRGMGLARQDELYRTLRIGQSAAVVRIVQQQVRSLVGGERRAKLSVNTLGSKRCLISSTVSEDAPAAA